MVQLSWWVIADHSDGRMRWKEVLWDWGSPEGRLRGRCKAGKVFGEGNLLTKWRLVWRRSGCREGSRE